MLYYSYCTCVQLVYYMMYISFEVSGLTQLMSVPWPCMLYWVLSRNHQLTLEYSFHTGSAQVRCFTTPGFSAEELNCRTGTDPEFVASSVTECCLSPSGQFFEGEEGCTPCIGM